MLFIFPTLVLIRHLWQLKIVAFPALMPNTCCSIVVLPNVILLNDLAPFQQLQIF